MLARLGLAFVCVAPGVDEAAVTGERPVDLVTRLARAKAATVAVREPTAWVIGSDQAAVRMDAAEGEVVLGKPASVAHCRAELLRCSGQTVSFLTAVALMHHASGELIEFIDTTRVNFRILDEALIERYVARDMPLDCAGGFKSEALGVTLCESIDAKDPTALIGLPLIRLSAALRSAGFELP